jgi:hypothetical protein
VNGTIEGDSRPRTRNDTAATLDYVRMARVVDGVYGAVAHTSH